MKELYLLAFDLGASNGRAILGTYDGRKLSTREVHRFANDPVLITGHTYWNILHLFEEIKKGLQRAWQECGDRLASIGIATWGVDYGLLDATGQLLGNPHHYRDSRTEGVVERVLEKIPKEELFRETGNAFQKYNTLYQLYSMKMSKPEILDSAGSLLMLPDLFSYFLTGEKITEFTVATTSQLLRTNTHSWSSKIIRSLGFPERIFGPIQDSGGLRGKLLPEISAELGVGCIPVATVASHDTASAVAAVPAVGDSYAFLSSGTWSLMGCETLKPIITTEAMALNYTNEGCAGGGYRFLKNIMGLWIIQECRRQWTIAGKRLAFAEISKMAERARPFSAFIDPTDEIFFPPGDMPRRVREYCTRSGQRIPENEMEIARCVFDSLAFKYRWTLEKMEEITRRKIDTLHIVGGGSRNGFLNQLSANALNRPVVAGPAEATAVGNLIVQTIALGEVADIPQARSIIRESFATESCAPRNAASWDEAYDAFKRATRC